MIVKSKIDIIDWIDITTEIENQAPIQSNAKNNRQSKFNETTGEMKISRRPLAATVPSMAMGDIAFNLLIFFVILAKATDDSHLQWEPADSTEVIRAGAAKASIVIDAESKYYLNGQQVGIAQLGPQIEQILEGPAGDDRRVLQKSIAPPPQITLNQSSRPSAKLRHHHACPRRKKKSTMTTKPSANELRALVAELKREVRRKSWSRCLSNLMASTATSPPLHWWWARLLMFSLGFGPTASRKQLRPTPTSPMQPKRPQTPMRPETTAEQASGSSQDPEEMADASASSPDAGATKNAIEAMGIGEAAEPTANPNLWKTVSTRYWMAWSERNQSSTAIFASREVDGGLSDCLDDPVV